MSGKWKTVLHLLEITNCEIWKYKTWDYILPTPVLLSAPHQLYKYLFLIILYCFLLRLTVFSILQSKWVLFERFWLHIHLAITVRQSLPVHLYHSITDLFMTLCSKNGQRYVGPIVCLSFRYRKLCLTSLFVLQRDVVHIHVSAVEPMPSRLYHRFIVRNIVYWINKPCVSLILHVKMCASFSFNAWLTYLPVPIDLRKMYLKLFKFQLLVTCLLSTYLCY